MSFTTSEENYIKSIYHLQQGTGLVNTNSVAAEMNTRPASVTDMLKKLKSKKLLQYEKYKGFKLSEAGKKAALAVVRKHRLWEYFLVEHLKFDWDKVHPIAEELEHISSEELVQRLDNFLGNPLFDPHGDPIPKSNGEIPTTVKTLLSEIEIGKSCRVVAVKDTSSVFLQYLEQLSVNIGTKIKVLDIVPFDNSMLLQIGKEIKTTVSKRFAESLLVD